MLCRLTFPLCYNFTFLVDITGTVFQSVGCGSGQVSPSTAHALIRALSGSGMQQMGDVAFMPLLGVGFNVYFPIIMSLLTVLVFFNIFERVLARFHVRVFRYSDVTEEATAEGEQIIDRGKRIARGRGRRARARAKGKGEGEGQGQGRG